jgi:hypothetical protein
VPRPPSELLWARQAPEHFSPGLQIIYYWLYLIWCITFRSCLQTLLHYTLFHIALPDPCYPGVRGQKLLSLLRPVEVGWLPVIREL